MLSFTMRRCPVARVAEYRTMQSWFTQPDAQGSAPACKSPLLLCGKNAEQKEGEGKKLILVPPPAGKKAPKKCLWVEVSHFSYNRRPLVGNYRLRCRRRCERQLIEDIFHCDQSRNPNIKCVRQFTSNICPYQLMIVTTQTYLKRWQCADWSRQELEKEQTRRGEQRRGREFHRSCRHCYSCTSAAAAATCRDIWRIGWHLDHSLLPPPPPPPPSPSKKTQEPAPRTFLTTPRVSNFHFAQAPFPFRFLRARVPFSCKWKLHFELTAAAAAALDGA